MFRLPRLSSPLVFSIVTLASVGYCFAEGLPGAPSTVVAKQGSASVTLEDIDAFAARMPEGERPGFFNSPTRIQNVIQTMLLQKELADEARAAGLDKDPAVKRQLTMAETEELSKVRMQYFRAGLKIPDFNELAQEEFIAHKDKYITRGKRVVKHILISTKTRSDADAKALAETVDKEAKAHPDQFDALVDKYSDDPGKSTNHGELSNAGDPSRYVEEFAKAAAALKQPGEISLPVKTTFGFHIIKLIESTPDTVPTFAQAKAGIVKQLRNDYIDKQVRNHGDELRNLPLDANADLVASLRTRYGKPEAAPAAAPSK